MAKSDEVVPVLEHNISAILRRRKKDAETAPMQERIADAITAFTGSMRFVYLHLAVFGFWIVANLGWIGFVPAWDPTFVVLAMVASVEAIFLSTFVLISQNRMSAIADRRADLDLQICLLSEHEITKLTELTSAIAAKLEVKSRVDPELNALKQETDPEIILDKLEEHDAR